MPNPLTPGTDQHGSGQPAVVPEGLSAILDALDDCVFIVALPEWQCTYVNDASRAVFGWPARAFFADISRWFDSIHPDDHAHVNGQLRLLFEEGRADFEYRVVHPDGTALVVHSRARLRYGVEGRPISFDCATRDVTERTLAREARARDDARFRAVIDASPVPMALNEARNITYLNPAFIATFGYGLGDIPTLDRWWPLAYPDPGYRAWVESMWGERLEDARRRRGASEPLELRIRCKDGAERVVVAAVAALGASSAGAHLVVLHDVTERKRVEDEMRARVQEQAVIWDAVGDSVFLLGVEPDGGYRFKTINPAFATTTGLPAAAVVGRRVEEVIPAASLPLVLSRYAQAIRDGVPVRWEEISNYPTGRLIGEVCVAPVLDAEGRCKHLVGVVRDVTRQRQAHEELTAAREAAVEASRIKSRFLANMSHELRTPLNGVLGLTELALASAQSDEQRTLLRAAHESGQLLLAILGDILDISKIEAGRLEVEQVPFDLRQIVSESARVVRLAAEAKGVALLCNVEPGVSSWVCGDAIRVRQILHNLCTNAVKFTEHGHVALSVGRDASDGQVWIRVEDTGCGIDPERLGRIFDAFTQADGSTTRCFGGTGLGLTICRELAGLMGGRIWAESTPGRGSTFHVRLPLPPASNPAPSAAPPPQPAAPERASASLRVLLAEDNPINALVARRMLERMGHAVTHVLDGVRALDVLGDGGGFDVVLMDVQMPLLDGLDTTRTIRARGLRIPVVALTANAMQGDAEICLAAGMDDYVPKPIELERLRAALERLASRAETPHP